MARFGDIAGPLGQGIGGLADVGAGAYGGAVQAEIQNQRIRSEQTRLQLERQRIAEEDKAREAELQHWLHPEFEDIAKKKAEDAFNLEQAEKSGYPKGSYEYNYLRWGKMPASVSKERTEPKALGSKAQTIADTDEAMVKYAGRHLNQQEIHELLFPKERLGGGDTTPKPLQNIKAMIAEENRLRKSAGLPPLTPQEEISRLHKDAGAGAAPFAWPKSSVNEKKIVEDIDRAETTYDGFKEITQKLIDATDNGKDWPKGGFLGNRVLSIKDALSTKYENFWYKRGISGDELAALRQQYLSLSNLFVLTAAQPYMKGRPSQFYMQQIMAHLSVPAGDPKNALERANKVVDLLRKYKAKVLRQNGIDPQKWDEVSSGVGQSSSSVEYVPVE